MPRILTTAITTVVVAAVALAATAVAQPAQRFGDVPPDHYAFEAASWMADNGITTGCGDGSNFCPDQPLTRAHIAAFLHRYHTKVASGAEAPATTTPTTTAAPTSNLILDHYWSADGYSYFVKLGNYDDAFGCEVHLTNNGRRTGDSGIELTGGTPTTTVEVRGSEFSPLHDFDAFEAECR